VSKTLGPSAERIDKGKTSAPRRETVSSVYHVIAGRGHSIIDEKTYEWKQGDTFCIPVSDQPNADEISHSMLTPSESWYKYQHCAGPEDTVYLYRFDDRPMIEALGFYRSEGMDTEALVT
jgi:gentisate 1,2-dioxygenase